jgi:hypothetical protein
MDDPRKPGPKTIELCVAAWQRARANLAADPLLASDETILGALLDADPNILPPDGLLARFVGAIVFAESRAAEAKGMCDAMAARQRRYIQRAEIMRAELLEVMHALHRTTFSGSPLATASVANGPYGVGALDETKLPDEYFRTVRSVDRAKLLSDLRDGLVIDGAELSNPKPVLRIIKARGKPAEPEQE